MSLKDIAFSKVQEIMKRREEILEAFIAKHGIDPDEIIQCEQPSTGKYWVEKKKKWISVKDRLPEQRKDVLTLDKSGEEYIINFICEDRKWLISSEFITHWMPLPEPPHE